MSRQWVVRDCAVRSTDTNSSRVPVAQADFGEGDIQFGAPWTATVSCQGGLRGCRAFLDDGPSSLVGCYLPDVVEADVGKEFGDLVEAGGEVVGWVGLRFGIGGVSVVLDLLREFFFCSAKSSALRRMARPSPFVSTAMTRPSPRSPRSGGPEGAGGLDRRRERGPRHSCPAGRDGRGVPRRGRMPRASEGPRRLGLWM